MATLQYTKYIADQVDLYDYYDDADLTAGKATSSKATFADDSGYSIELSGDDFDYGSDGELTDGDVDSVILRDAEGDKVATFSNEFSWDADDVYEALDSSVEEMFRELLSGNDAISGNVQGETIYGYNSADVIDGEDGDDSIYGGNGADTLRGGKGSDLLDGGKGNDLLYGNSGPDHFVFAENYGKDVITGFDANGGAGSQDFIVADYDDVVDIDSYGDNVVIDFGSGDVLTLLDVDKDDITAADFQV
jgi:serralysin